MFNIMPWRAERSLSRRHTVPGGFQLTPESKRTHSRRSEPDGSSFRSCMPLAGAVSSAQIHEFFRLLTLLSLCRWQSAPGSSLAMPATRWNSFRRRNASNVTGVGCSTTASTSRGLPASARLTYLQRRTRDAAPTVKARRRASTTRVSASQCR